MAERLRGWRGNVVLLVGSFLVGVICLGLAVYTSWFGQGTYLPAKLLFPWTLLSTAYTGLIATPMLVFALFQFPVYGLIVVLARRQGHGRAAAGLVLALHAAGIALALLFSSSAFGS